MAVRINLLPWREEIRQTRRREFFIWCGIAAAAAAVLVFLVYLAINESISAQNDSNQVLRDEITKLNNQIGQIRDLKNRLDAMNKQKGIVEALQKDRADTVFLMQGLLKIVPDKVFINDIKQDGKLITLNCTASDASGVIQFIENINASDFAINPQLLVSEATKLEIKQRQSKDANPSAPKNELQQSEFGGETPIVHKFSVVFTLNLTKIRSNAAAQNAASAQPFPPRRP